MGKTYKYDRDEFGDNYEAFRRFKKERRQKEEEKRYEEQETEDDHEQSEA